MQISANSAAQHPDLETGNATQRQRKLIVLFQPKLIEGGRKP
jgi:hypothetical protein